MVNIKFNHNPSSKSRVVPCGQTDGRTDGNEGANSRFSQRCEAPEKVHASVLYSKSTEPKRGGGEGVQQVCRDHHNHQKRRSTAVVLRHLSSIPRKFQNSPKSVSLK
jgi:hypothetical protein